MSLLQDLRFALRLIVKDRWFTAVAVAALSLGIGVNATVFTLVNAVLIRGLPFKDSGQLYMLGVRRPSQQRANSTSYPDLLEWQSQAKTFEAIGAFSRTGMSIADEHGFPQAARGTWLTANTFRILGQQPLIGRDFAPGEDRKGAERVVILGYGLWKSRYAGDPNVIGHIVRINREPATIIGVMPEGLMFPTNSELWGNFVPSAEQERRDRRPLDVFGRLKADATHAQAQAELDAIARRIAAQFPETNKEFTEGLVQTFNERFNGGEIRQVFLAMMGAVGFVLLIACANVANLLLSRSAHRAREIALRVALGASRWRVIRQLLVESIMLGLLGGVLGGVLALVGARLFEAALPTDSGKPYWIEFTMDWVVVGFLAAVCIATGVLFGLAPALQVSRTNVNEILKEGGRGSAGNRRAGWLSGGMVVVEIALTIVLLAGAGLMTRSFMKLYSLDLGMKTDDLMSTSVQLQDSKYATAESRVAFFDRLTPRLAAVAGVEAAALTTGLPPNGGWRRTFEVEGRHIAKESDWPGATDVAIDPTFFSTVGVQLLRGRGFNERDGAPGLETAIVNQRFASEFFPNEDPIGRRFRFSVREGEKPAVWRTIVGISPNIRHAARQEVESRSVVYIPLRQEAVSFAFLLVRSRLDPSAVMSAVRREVQAIDPDQALFTIQTLDQLLAQQRWPYRVFGSLFAIFAVIALVLSAVGIYAVMAYSVNQRTQEIGVRMALGAEGRQVSWLILRRGLIQLAIGVSLGLGGAWLTSKALQPLLFSVTPTDPVTFTAITLVLCIVALAACAIPARRATRLDPLVALRAE